MSYYFEIANISYRINMSNNLDSNICISPDIVEYFTQEMTQKNRCVNVDLNLLDSSDELQPITGIPIYQDSYRIVLNNNEGKESRIFFQNANCIPYATYSEAEKNSVYIQCLKNIMPNNTINMRLLELFCFEKILLEENAFILHASYIEYRGKAIVFTAPSGTGKSTQGALWVEHRQATLINGDRCVIQKINNQYYVHGTPFCGSSATNRNCTLPLSMIVIVNQNPNNYVKKPSHTYVIEKLFTEVTINRWNASAVTNVFDILEHLYRRIEVVDLFCTPTYEAVEVLDKYMLQRRGE